MSLFSAIGNALGIAAHTVLRVGGVAVQVLAAGGGFLFGLDPKYAVGAWAIGKVLEAFGVHIAVSPAPPTPTKP